MNFGRKVRRLRVANEFMADLIKNDVIAAEWNDVPLDLRVVGCVYEQPFVTTLFVASETFTPIDEGQEIPLIEFHYGSRLDEV